MKKLIALVLALALVFAVAVASAATITINRDSTHLEGTGVTDTTAYHYYKIFDAVTPDNFELDDSNIETTKTDAAGFTYSIAKTSSWLTTVQNLTEYFKLTEKTNDYLVELVGDATAARAKLIASALLAATTDGSGSIAPDGSLTLGAAEDVPNGYYLIATTGQPNLVLATTDVEITEKNDFPSVDKEVASTDEYAEVGKDVTFTLDVTVPADAKLPITLTDEMTAGLKFHEIVSVKGASNADISVANPSADPVVYGYTHTAGVDDQHFTIVFDAHTVEANEGAHLVVTYTATITADAYTRATETNKVTLTYGNYSQWDTDSLKTNQFDVRKYDGSDSNHTPIAGAIFQLKHGNDIVKLIKISDTEYRVADATQAAGTTKSFFAEDTITNNDLVTDFITVANTEITIKGVDSDVDYTLTELKAPTGFNINSSAQNVPVEADDSYEFAMENNKGTELPSTGGIGTTIFYILGGLLVVGAAVILVARRKAGQN